MINILKNDFCRTLPRFGAVIAMFVMTFAAIFFAVYVTGIQQVKGRVALVTENDSVTFETKYLSVDVMKQQPLPSALVRQQYDAVVTDSGNGRYNIQTLRDNKFKNMISTLLKNPKATIPQQKTDRNVGVNVIGFLMIFLSTGAFFYFFPFADDKEQGQILRISASPVSFRKYLAAHCLFCLSSFIPAWLILAALKVFGWNLGFTLGQYILLFLLLSIPGISFALLLNTLIKKPDNAEMLGYAVIIITSTLAGCFFSFNKSNTVMAELVKILPQKQFVEFALNLQNGEALQHPFSYIYILAISVVMFATAYSKLKHDYVERA